MEDISENVTIEQENVEQNVDNSTKPESSKKPEKQEEKKSKGKKILDWIIYGVFGVCIAFCALVFISQKLNNGYVFDYMFPAVATDSMDPVYPVGSVLIVKKVNPADIKEGDDVTFMYNVEELGGPTKVTHRIFYVSKNPNKPVGEGHYIFKAHGINKESERCKIGDSAWDCTDQYQEFSEIDLLGRVEGKSNVFGFVFTIVQSPWGLIGMILVPSFYLIITSVVDIFKKLPDEDELNKQDMSVENRLTALATDDDPLAGLTEEEKLKLKKELLDEIMGKGGKKK